MLVFIRGFLLYIAQNIREIFNILELYSENIVFDSTEALLSEKSFYFCFLFCVFDLVRFAYLSERYGKGTDKVHHDSQQERGILSLKNTLRDRMFSKEIELSEGFPEHLPLISAQSSVQSILTIISIIFVLCLFPMHKSKFTGIQCILDLQAGYSPDKISRNLGSFTKPPKIMVDTSS